MATETNDASVERDLDSVWLTELRDVIASARSGKGDVGILLSTYANSVFKLHDRLSIILSVAQLPEGVESNAIFDDTIPLMRAFLPEIMTLHELLPKDVLLGERVVTYAREHARSWAEIVLKSVYFLVTLTSPTTLKMFRNRKTQESFSNRKMLEMLIQKGFDAGFVKVQLELEFEQVEKRLFADSEAQSKAHAKISKRRGAPPDPEKDRIEAMYRKSSTKADYYAIAVSLKLEKWNGRTPYKRVERVVNAMHQRDRRLTKRK